MKTSLEVGDLISEHYRNEVRGIYTVLRVTKTIAFIKNANGKEIKINREINPNITYLSIIGDKNFNMYIYYLATPYIIEKFNNQKSIEKLNETVKNIKLENLTKEQLDLINDFLNKF